MESTLRSLFKTISWRVFAVVITMLLVYAVSGEIYIALGIGALELVTKSLAYFFHERIWNIISYGRKQKRIDIQSLQCGQVDSREVSVKSNSLVVWFTGLSGAGKTTLADMAYDYLLNQGHKVVKLDGDVIREITPSVGFSKEARNEHIKNVGLMSAVLERHGFIVLVSLISPYKETRDFSRSMCSKFVEVYVNTPLEECEKRDPKGLYRKARSGQIKQFTGISDPYEPPGNPEMVINTCDNDPFGQLKNHLEKELL